MYVLSKHRSYSALTYINKAFTYFVKTRQNRHDFKPNNCFI